MSTSQYIPARHQPCLFFLVCCLCIFFIGIETSSCKQPDGSKKLLIVNSYEPGQVCGQPQEDGIVKSLATAGFKEGVNLQIEHFFMDTRKTFTLPEQIKERGSLALARIKEFKPDLVITLDDNAIETVMLPLVGTDIPVVFSGMNQQPEIYNQQKKYIETRQKPGANVTGVYEKLHIVKALEVMNSITGVHRAAVIVDDSSTGEAVTAQIKKETSAASSPVSLNYYQVGSFEAFKQRILAINEDPEIGAVYPVAFTLKDRNNQTVTTNEIVTWQLANLKKPDMAGNYFLCQLGMFGGAAVDFQGMGEEAGRKAAAILQGAAPGDIPIDDADGQALVFNLERAKQLGITIPMDILSAADMLHDSILLKPIDEPSKVLIIQSYEKGTGCGAIIETGLLEALNRTGYKDGERLALHHFYMDTQNTHITKEAIAHQAQLALIEIDRLQPQVIILMDDNAFEHVLPPLIGGKYPVLFAGTNVPLELYNAVHPFMNSRQHPGKNVTGVTEEHEIVQNLNLIKSLVPTAKTAVILYSDATPFVRLMGDANEAYIATHRDSLPIRFLSPEKVTKLSDYQALITKYNDDPTVDIIYTFAPISLIKDDGTISPVNETIAWMAANQKKPDFTWMTNWVELGYLASAGIDVKATGENLAGMVIKVLNGANPGDLPIDTPSKYSIALNLDRAKQLGIDIPLDILEAAETVYSRPCSNNTTSPKDK
jgi:putative tryptophan/tyrosine transport system substrate-binding protein